MTLLNSPFLFTLTFGLSAVVIIGLLLVFFGKDISIREFGAFCLLVIAAALLGGLV